MRHNSPVPAIAERGQAAVKLLAQLVESHAPVEQPHGQSGDGAVEHGACVQADDYDGDDAEEVCEVEEVEALASDGGKAGQEHCHHYQTGNDAGEYQRSPPHRQRRPMPRPNLIVEISWVQDWDSPSILVASLVEKRGPASIEDAMDQDQAEENVRLDHVEGVRGGRTELEERSQGAVPGDWQQDHPHRDIGEVTRLRDGGDDGVAGKSDALGREVVSHANPPDPDQDPVETAYPEDEQHAAEA